MRQCELLLFVARGRWQYAICSRGPKSIVVNEKTLRAPCPEGSTISPHDVENVLGQSSDLIANSTSFLLHRRRLDRFCGVPRVETERNVAPAVA